MITIATLLERQAARHPGMVALVDEATGRQWTIADLERASAAAASSQSAQTSRASGRAAGVRGAFSTAGAAPALVGVMFQVY